MIKPKPSCYPQNIGSWVWYYENKRSIEVFVDAQWVKMNADASKGVRFTIPRAKLRKSLSRMQ